MNSSIDLKTDSQGKFAFPAGLKYFYNVSNWIVVIVKSNVPSPSFLGIKGEDAADGVKITQIIPKGSAENAQLKNNDIITEFGGIKITGMAALKEVIAKHPAGNDVKIKIQRDSKAMELSVKMLANPEETEPGIKFAFGSILKAGESELHREEKSKDITLRLDCKINQ